MIALDKDAFVRAASKDLVDRLSPLPDTVNALLDSPKLDFGDPYRFEREALDALAKVFRPHQRHEGGEVLLDGVTIIPGSLHVDGSLTYSHLYVLGDLTVTGAMANSNPHDVLAVGGSVRARTSTGHL